MIAIIIGATSGIGLEVARVLSEQGWTLGLAGRRENLLQEIQRELPGVAAIRRIDVNDEAAPRALQELIDQLGGLDLYFHSSGIGFQNPELNAEKEIATALTNAVGATRMLCAAFKYFESHPEREAHIALISSIAGTKGLGAAPAYSASKRYASHYLECLAQLCNIKRLRHIHIHDVRPGFVRTALLAGSESYPMQLHVRPVAEEIVSSIMKGRSIIIVDWRYRLLVSLWRLIPRWLWVRLRISTKAT